MEGRKEGDRKWEKKRRGWGKEERVKGKGKRKGSEGTKWKGNGREVKELNGKEMEGK